MPEPVLKSEFLGLKVNVLNTAVNNYTFTYTLELPRVRQIACGKDLTIIAAGYSGTLTKKTEIFVKNCKSGYWYYLLLFFQVFWGKVFTSEKHCLVVCDQ